jgi:hypothetical protein
VQLPVIEVLSEGIEIKWLLLGNNWHFAPNFPQVWRSLKKIDKDAIVLCMEYNRC